MTDNYVNVILLCICPIERSGSKYISIHMVELSSDACKSRSPFILTICWSSQQVFCLGSVRSGCTDPHHYQKAATMTGPDPNPAPSDVGRCTSERRPCYQVPLSRWYSQRNQSRSELSVQQMLWMGACKIFQILKCSSVSEK